MSQAALDAVIGRIRPADRAAGEAAQEAFDSKTKPRGSLGELERLACRVAAIRRTPSPGRLRAAVVVAAADHGYARREVSAYPQEVTGQMLANFAAGGAAVNVLARETGAQLVVVDAGVAAPVEHQAVRSLRLGAGTADATEGPAMDARPGACGSRRRHGARGGARRRRVRDRRHGRHGHRQHDGRGGVVRRLLPAEPEAVCGRGTGLDDEGLARKVEAVGRALAANPADPAIPWPCSRAWEASSSPCSPASASVPPPRAASCSSTAS